ncbi:MAG TPA: ATP-binding protein, partial [Gemmatimonas sp.]|nr:ATP-binding protein [Gemmatimonas sp.]
QIVTNAIETSRPVIDSMRHALHIVEPRKPVHLRGDPTRLTQVVANLLNNAAKYQSEEGRIEVRMERDGDHVVIEVHDDGIGIQEDMRTRIFELFTQGDRAPERAQGGLGIGLSLVKQMVELHDGTVTAISEGPGRGSQFVVRLPCLPDSTMPEPTSTPAATPAADAPRRILVVDDSVDAAESMAMLLRLRGHEVQVAHNGYDALELAAASKPSVVLLDIGLPGMDGYEVCRRFRANGLADVRIIAMTGYGMEQDRQRAKDAGFDVHTVKPVAFSELLKLLADPAP